MYGMHASMYAYNCALRICNDISTKKPHNYCSSRVGSIPEDCSVFYLWDLETLDSQQSLVSCDRIHLSWQMRSPWPEPVRCQGPIAFVVWRSKVGAPRPGMDRNLAPTIFVGMRNSAAGFPCGHIDSTWSSFWIQDLGTNLWCLVSPVISRCAWLNWLCCSAGCCGSGTCGDCRLLPTNLGIWSVLVGHCLPCCGWSQHPSPT